MNSLKRKMMMTMTRKIRKMKMEMQIQREEKYSTLHLRVQLPHQDKLQIPLHPTEIARIHQRTLNLSLKTMINQPFEIADKPELTLNKLHAYQRKYSCNL